MRSYLVILVVLFYLLMINSCQKESAGLLIKIYPDSILSDVSHHPVGINLDYFMDDDNYLKPERSTADALKAMGVKYLRYPGGNKSDFYFFSVPPYEKSVPTLARTGKGAVGGRHKMLDNYSGFKYDVLDFDEFMTMCKEIGGVPTICVAADEYLVDYPEGCTKSSREELIKHAVEWVRYANIKKNYSIKYWMIGNETWHEQNVNSTAEIYARDVVDFSIAMKEVDPSIYIIPNGNAVEFCDTVLDIAGEYIDYFCISNYPVWNYRAGYDTYRDTLQDLMHPVDRALTAINKYAEANDTEKIGLIVCEYGPYDWAGKWEFINDMGHALCNFEITGKQLLVPEIIFSQFWNTRWINNDTNPHSVFDALNKNGNFNAIGYTMMIWGNFLGDQMLKTTSTIHIRSFASYIPETGKLYVYLLNKTDSTQAVNLQIENSKIRSLNQHWVLAGDSPDDTDPVYRQQEIISGRNPQDIILPGTSISVLEYIIKQ
jgi:alpha-N-arabinofuranosidase